MPLQQVHSSLSPWEIFQSLHARSRACFFLDSGEPDPSEESYSYIGADPFLEITLQGARIKLTGELSGNYPAAELVPLLRSLLKKYSSKKDFPFFTGGAAGYFGYELAPLFDRVRLRKKPGPSIPKLYLGFYRDVIVYDHRKKKYWMGHPDPRLTPCGDDKPHPFSFSQFHPDISRAQFEAMVRRAKAYIAAGDIYQANLSQRFSFRWKGSALPVYGALRKINPSPFSSFLKIGGLQIISNSPEILVQKRGRECKTKPIAGTRPRLRPAASTPGVEADAERELLQNEKERAEHIMLVDLERNDLGRVCVPASVRVAKMMEIEKYSHVIHIVSTVTGRLAKNKDGLDLLRAMFPGGTITGCPKIHCMEIIDELEPVRRGIYTGSIGFLDFAGDLELNIVIRTLVLEKNRGTFQVGAGIVYDSDPKKEYEETLHKGEALAEALVHAGV